MRRPLRRIGRLLFPIGLSFFCLVYGFFFALTAPYLLIPFVIPILILVLLSIWALPDAPHAPLRAVEFCFAAVLISRVLWPNYLALELPGLPWITMLRLFGFPMAFLLLISLSTSANFRSEIHQSLRATPGLLTCVIGLAIMNFLTIPLSEHPASSLQLALLDLIYMVGMIVIGAWIARTPGRGARYIELLLMMAVPIMLITIVETRMQGVLWNGHVPSFLKVNDPAAIRALSDTTRGTTGEYRAKATFTTPLGLAEYLAVLTPFFIHKAFRARTAIVRILSALALPVSFFCIIATNARLGVVGFLVSVLLYLLFWGLTRFARDRRDIIGAAVVYGYPALSIAVLTAVLSIHRFRMMVLGGGEQASSNEARQSQLTMGIPKILQNPIGHGVGESGNAMGYAAGDFITVDNYYLTVSLDNGFAGLALFLAIFLTSIIASIRTLMKHPDLVRDEEISLLLPIAVSFSAFLVIKSVFSQTDSHMLLFALVGISTGLLYRARGVIAQSAISEAEASASHDRGRSIRKGLRQRLSTAGTVRG